MSKKSNVASSTKDDAARATPEAASLPAEAAAAPSETTFAAPDDWNEPGGPDTPYITPDELPDLATPEAESLPGVIEEEVEYIMDFLPEAIAAQCKPRIAVGAIQHLRFIEGEGEGLRVYQLDETKRGTFVLRPVAA
jgi:hypothetical protein